MNMHVVTANRLTDGAVVYFTAEHTWSQWIADAIICDQQCDAASLLDNARSAASSEDVIEPYVIEVYKEAQTIKPLRYREAIRARGPSIHTALANTIPVAMPGDQAAAPKAFQNGL